MRRASSSAAGFAAVGRARAATDERAGTSPLVFQHQQKALCTSSGSSSNAFQGETTIPPLPPAAPAAAPVAAISPADASASSAPPSAAPAAADAADAASPVGGGRRRRRQRSWSTPPSLPQPSEQTGNHDWAVRRREAAAGDDDNGDGSSGKDGRGGGDGGIGSGGGIGIGKSGRGRGAAASAAATGSASASVGTLKDCNRELRGYSIRGQGEKAVELINRMRAEGVTPTDKSYSSAINACGNGGRWKQALALLREASSSRSSSTGSGGSNGATTPSAFHYTAAVKACGSALQGDQVSERQYFSS